MVFASGESVIFTTLAITYIFTPNLYWKDFKGINSLCGARLPLLATFSSNTHCLHLTDGSVFLQSHLQATASPP